MSVIASYAKELIVSRAETTSDETQPSLTALVNDEGLHLMAEDTITVEWNHIANFYKAETDSDSYIYLFEIAGGLSLALESDIITDEMTAAPDPERDDRPPMSDMWSDIFDDDDIPDIQAFQLCTSHLLKSFEVFFTLGVTDEHVDISDVLSLGANLTEHVHAFFDNFFGDKEHSDEEKHSVLRMLNSLCSLNSAIEQHFTDIFCSLAATEEKEADLCEAIRETLQICFRVGLMRDGKLPYMLIRNFSAWELDDRDNAADRLDLTTREAFVDWGNPELASKRRIIVCTDAPTPPQHIFDAPPSGVFITLPQDLTYYNMHTENEAHKLIFPAGHPCNGEVYVQHPFRQNVYYCASGFHSAVLRDKHNELMRLLRALGARSVSARLQPKIPQGTEAKIINPLTVLAVASPLFWLAFKAEKACKAAIAEFKGDKQPDIRRCLEDAFPELSQSFALSPSDSPKLPEDLVFFAEENSWKLLADSVLQGHSPNGSIVLDYTRDYGIRSRTFDALRNDLSALLPDFSFNEGAEFDQALAFLRLGAWHYSISFTEDNDIDATPDSASETARAEALLLKRAKRYLANDGDIDDYERADLEALAKKYSINELRLEELIEEAFETK